MVDSVNSAEASGLETAVTDHPIAAFADAAFANTVRARAGDGRPLSRAPARCGGPGRRP
jgi:hypothetical protein